jgi:hypothetical protein
MGSNVNLKAPSYMPALLTTNTSGSSLLSSLYAGGDRAAEASAATPDQADAEPIVLAAAEPRFRHDLTQFAQALAVAKTPAQLLANPVALRVLLTAYGLGDKAADVGLATQALLADPARSNSLVNQLTDPRWISVNQTFSFATKGLSVVSEPRTIRAITSLYAEALSRTQSAGLVV